jgi:DNA-binding NarL/FixJ family response regulator
MPERERTDDDETLVSNGGEPGRIGRRSFDGERPVRIVIIDDHTVVRLGLAYVIRERSGLAVAGEAGDVGSGWRMVVDLQPDVVLMDVDLPDGSGIDLAARVHREWPAIRVIVLTGHMRADVIRAALEGGVSGVVFKVNATNELLGAIQAARTGGVFLSPEASALLLQDGATNARTAVPGGLTPREVEVLRRIAEGQSTKEIAFALGVSGKTAETHRARLMHKLHLSSVAELTRFAVRHGLVAP